EAQPPRAHDALDRAPRGCGSLRPHGPRLPELGRRRGTGPGAAHVLGRLGVVAARSRRILVVLLLVPTFVGRVVGALHPARGRELEQVAGAEALVGEARAVAQHAEADAR